MAETVKLEGLNDIAKKLKALPVKLQRKVLTKSLRAGSRLIVSDAKRRVPKDTGKLKRNIATRVRRKGSKGERALQVYVRRRGKKEDPKNAFYWTFLEFGTRYISPRPFLRPAFEANKTEAVRRISAAMGPLLKTEVDKLSR